MRVLLLLVFLLRQRNWKSSRVLGTVRNWMDVFSPPQEYDKHNPAAAPNRLTHEISNMEVCNFMQASAQKPGRFLAAFFFSVFWVGELRWIIGARAFAEKIGLGKVVLHIEVSVWMEQSPGWRLFPDMKANAVSQNLIKSKMPPEIWESIFAKKWPRLFYSKSTLLVIQMPVNSKERRPCSFKAQLKDLVVLK